MLGVSSRLSTSICESCCSEVSNECLSPDHVGLCDACATDLQASLDAEKAVELLSDDEIVAALLDADDSMAGAA